VKANQDERGETKESCPRSEGTELANCIKERTQTRTRRMEKRSRNDKIILGAFGESGVRPL